MTQSNRFTIPFIILLCICTSCSDSSTSSDSDTDDPEPNPNAELDCERLGYPCSLDEVPDEIYHATYDALVEAKEIREDGTMEDVRTYLEGLPDMASVVGDDRSISFRFDGGSPAIFIDRSGSSTAQSKSANRSIVSDNEIYSNSVVGEDQNNDDKVNNRDNRIALGLGPYRWIYETADGMIDGLPEEYYEGSSDYFFNAQAGEQNVSLGNYSNWEENDLIVLITFGAEFCFNEQNCEYALFSGINPDDDLLDRTGVILGEYYDEETEQHEEVHLALSLDFFRSTYKTKLDNTLLILAGEDTGYSEVEDLANILGGENFVMTGWAIENIYSGDLQDAMLFFGDQLNFGLPVQTAIDFTDEPAFKRFVPNGGDQRIREVIQLVDLGGPLQDGEGITATRMNGTDHLNLVAVVDGVITDEIGDYSIRIELEGEVIGEGYTLTDAKKATDYGEYSYIVELEDIDTGQNLPSGELLELEAIVDLPEGGESRFEVMVQVASCHFNAFITGDFSGTFEGPARLRFGSDGSVGVDLQSTAYVNGETTPDNFTANTGTTVERDDDGNILPGEYTIEGGNAAQFDVFSASYIPGFEDADCSQCGGMFTVDSFDEIQDEEYSMNGSFDVTMPVTEPRPDPDNPFIITLSGSFTAVTGQISDFNSPFTQCQITYAED